MKKTKIKIALMIFIILLIIVLCFSAGVYAAYLLGATDVSYTKPDGTTVSVKEALDEVYNMPAYEIKYSWNEIAEIAKAISNDKSITDNSARATVTVGGVEKTLLVGQEIKLDGKTVRILGFNHDTLSSSTAYGSTTATGKAGISFEYVDFLTSAKVNSSNTNSGGWASTELRGTLNGTTYNSLSIKNIIKKVKKDYIPTYNVAKTQQTDDYLWLLSCGEIWDNGYNGGITRGYAMATEGKQYKYYKMELGSTKFSSSNDITKKPSASSSSVWWLRSPSGHSSGSFFCNVHSDGQRQQLLLWLHRFWCGPWLCNLKSLCNVL